MAPRNSKPQPLTGPLAKTLAVLGQSRFHAAIQVLAQGMRSTSPEIRQASLECLLARGSKDDFDAILGAFDCSDPQAFETLSGHLPRLIDAIDQGVASRDPEKRRRALWMVGKFQLESHFQHLVDTVCDPIDPNQMFAMDVVTQLARSLGLQARRTNAVHDSKRERLLQELLGGIESYPNHRVEQMMEWWATAAHWDDPMLHRVLDPSEPNEAATRILQSLERSKNKEVIGLISGVLWSRTANPALLQIVGKRKDAAFVEALCDQYRTQGCTRELKRNLGSGQKFRFLERDVFQDPKVSLMAKCGLAGLLTQHGAPADELLSRIAWLMSQDEELIHLAITDLIEHQRPIQPDLAVLALSDALDGPDIESSVPPPWKDSMRRSLETLISAYPRQVDRMRCAISNLFREFRCETLLEKLYDWPVAHLEAYARLTRLSQPDFLEDLVVELHAQAPQRRQRGLQAARHFGLDARAQDLVSSKIDDPIDEVRVEAILALAASQDRQAAMATLRPLVLERNAVIQQAASATLAILGEKP